MTLIISLIVAAFLGGMMYHAIKYPHDGDGPSIIPLHVTAQELPPDYFSPGTCIMNKEIVYSPWAIAFWNGKSYRFEREILGGVWIRA